MLLEMSWTAPEKHRGRGSVRPDRVGQLPSASYTGGGPGPCISTWGAELDPALALGSLSILGPETSPSPRNSWSSATPFFFF